MPKLYVEFFVRNIEPTSNTLKWTLINPSPEPLADKVHITGFNLYHTETRNDIPIKVNKELILDLEFQHIFENFTKFTRGYYQLEGVLSTGVSIFSSFFDILAKNIIFAEEMLRRDMFDLAGDVVPDNLPVLFYQKRFFGQTCSRCYVKGMGSFQAKCVECEGTGYQGGFHNPVMGWISYNAMLPQAIQNTGLKVTESSEVIVRTSSGFSYLKQGDCFREFLTPNRLFAVTGLQRTEFSNMPITYYALCKQIDSYHPLYLRKIPEIEIPEDIFYLNVFEKFDEVNTQLRTKY